ncbi:hypothetical protein ACG10_06250 [Azotobacter chroococcum]|nr:hypothetical protein ACG10_06250 [Azotobacter chroococcum]
MLVVERLGEGDAGPSGQRMLVVDQHGQVVLAVGNELQIAAGHGFAADAEIGIALGHAAHHVRAETLLDVHLDMFVGEQELGDLLGQELHDRGHVGEDAHMPARPFRVLAQLALQAFHVAHQLPGMTQQGLPGRGRHHAALAAHQQRGLEGRLDVGDALAQRRGRDELALAGAGDRALLADRHEQPQ